MKHSENVFAEIPAISIFNKSIVITHDNAYETLTINDKVPDTLDLIELITEEYETIFLMDINGMIENKPQIELIHSLTDFCEVWLDAGISEADSVYDLFVAGSHEVVLASKTIANLLELAKAFELSENLIFEIDYSGAVISPSSQLRSMSPMELAKEVKEIGMNRIIFADLDRVEKNKSLERNIIQSLIDLDLTVYVGGGIKLDDVHVLEELGATGGLIELMDILEHGQVEL